MDNWQGCRIYLTRMMPACLSYRVSLRALPSLELSTHETCCIQPTASQFNKGPSG